MRIILIDPPHSYLVQQRTQPPIGLLYLAASLRRGIHGIDHEPILYRLWDLSPAELDGIPEGDFYGVSATSLDYPAAVEIAIYLKKRHNRPVILGGFHATVCGDSEGVFDAICRGEGETVIFKIADDISSRKLKKIYSADRIDDLDSLPWPARDLLDYQGGNIFAFNQNFFLHGSTVIVGSRGCPFRCAFCGSVSLWKRQYRSRSPENISNEIDHVIKTLGIRQFRFSDEVFTLKKEYTDSLCRLLKPLNIAWKCSTRVHLLDKELLKAMRESGCHEIAVGVESGDPSVLQALKKDQTPEQVHQCCQRIAEAGINVRILMMINTPGETERTVDLNISLLERTPHVMASLAVFKPLPGCEIWDNPGSFKIDILSRDLSQYNLQICRADASFNILNEPPVVHIHGLYFEQMYKNRRRMFNYLENKNSLNRG